ncbi:hypothetical protein JCM9140_1982 [Halalkalibacter wakoensis JCM 9140]|uniref:EAL domain-containing protein n=1 Tax=Halalkalibacter wakoensis JCM 9140 TaxID=1236970 RepID=W4Q1W5_9BACI|nr:EAL domain-containing protein [Halalkalibacter wakoensis]GAE25957.1 hypothetical protein JCM9140_1982 [Halalkalibacter wakoensis JCM 9140]
MGQIDPYLTTLINKNMLYHVLQPIYALKSNNIIGYEALLRSKTNDTPVTLFKRAKQTDQLTVLDIYSFSNAIRHFSMMGQFCKPLILFINIYPSTLLSTLFKQALDELLDDPLLFLNPEQVVFEINENEDIHNFSETKKIISVLKKKGFLVASDDTGTRGGSLQRIIELDVDYVKLDRYFSTDLAQSVNKQKVISLLFHFFNDEKRIILEGIETAKDLEVAKSIGIELGQGFLLGRPTEQT